MFNCQDFLGNLSGYKQRYETMLSSLEACVGDRLDCLKKKHKLEQENEQLKLLVPRPAPPEITYVVEKDSAWVQQCLDKMGLDIIRLPLDAKYKLTNRSNFLNVIAYDWIDSKKYVAEVFDCENFAIAFKSHCDEYFGLNQVGIVIDYESGHGYNLVVLSDGTVWVLEPQSDGLVVWNSRVTVFYALEGAYVLL